MTTLPPLAKSPVPTDEEPRGVKIPAHVLWELSSADIAELVELWNGEPGERAKALVLADADCRNHWNRRKS